MKSMFHILLDTYVSLGMVEPIFTSTGGSTTTIVDALLADLLVPKQKDYAKNWYAFVDFVAAGAAPQGEYKRITGYSTLDWTYTTQAFSSAITSGMRIVIARTNEISFNTMFFLAQRAVERLGRVEIPNISLTTGDGQTEYSLPLGITREKIRMVYVQSNDDANDNQWIPVDWNVIPAAIGSANTLVIPPQDSGLTILITYLDYYAQLTSTSYFTETSYPLLQKQVELDAINFINKSHNQGRYWTKDDRIITAPDGTVTKELGAEKPNQYWLMEEQQTRQKLAEAEAKSPSPRPQRRNKLTHLGDL